MPRVERTGTVSRATRSSIAATLPRAMKKRRKIVVGNWKMNGLFGDLAELSSIASAAARSGVDVAMCLPATLICAAARMSEGIVIAAQDCHAAMSGAHTGDVSAAMVADAGARLVIIGHSERRRERGESDAVIRAKLESATRHGLGVILCVGESGAQHRDGNSIEVVRRQMSSSLPVRLTGEKLIIAYEPVWAIGSGRPASRGDIASMHAGVRQILRHRSDCHEEDIPILYGGSVTRDNAGAILSLDEVDGVLVGGASLTAEGMIPIIAAAAVNSTGEAADAAA